MAKIEKRCPECGRKFKGTPTQIYDKQECRWKASRKIGADGRAQRRRDVIGKLESLLAENEIDLEDVGSIEKVRVNEWEVVTKGMDGEPTKTKARAASIVINPKWESGPEWPVPQQAKPITVKVPKATRTPYLLRGWQTALVEPDTQFGFLRHPNGGLIPIHDPRAIQVSEMICEAERPDVWCNLGDYLDLAEMGKYRLEPAMIQTTQPSLEEAYRHAAVQRAFSAFGYIHEGNHDLRLMNFLLDNASAAFGIRRAKAPESWPVLSVPYLLRFDELGIEYEDGYPAGYHYINDHLATFHGFSTSSGNSPAASKVIRDEQVNTIFGHDHKSQTIYKTVGNRGNQWRTFAHSPGTLARIDGYVPGAGRHHGRRLDGEPRRDWANWQQGITIVRFVPGDGPCLLEHIEINEGVAYHQGQEFRSDIHLPMWRDAK